MTDAVQKTPLEVRTPPGGWQPLQTAAIPRAPTVLRESLPLLMTLLSVGVVGYVVLSATEASDRILAWLEDADFAADAIAGAVILAVALFIFAVALARRLNDEIARRHDSRSHFTKQWPTRNRFAE